MLENAAHGANAQREALVAAEHFTQLALAPQPVTLAQVQHLLFVLFRPLPLTPALGAR